MIRLVKQYKVNDVYTIFEATPKLRKAGNTKLPAPQCARQEARNQHLTDYRKLEGLSFRIKYFPTKKTVVLVNAKPQEGKPASIKTSITEFHRWKKIKRQPAVQTTAE